MMQMEKLTESEEIVMKAIWDSGKEPVLSNVVDRVNSHYGKDWKPQTVSTFLSKLVRKGYLSMHRNGKIYLYQIKVTEAAYNKGQLDRLYTYLYHRKKSILQADLDSL